MLSLKKIYTYLFYLGIFFIPFNSYEGIAFLGEYQREGAIVFFLLAIALFFVDVLFKGKIKFPLSNILIQFLIVIILLLFLSILLNASDVSTSYFKMTSGFSRFFRQMISLGIVLTFFILTYKIVSENLRKSFITIRRVLRYSLFIVWIYAFLEILVLKFNFTSLKPILFTFNYFPFTEVWLDYKFGRISSVSQEPPFLAIYLITIAGWMFSYILSKEESKFKKYLPTLMLFILTFVSGSRTALIVVTIQLIIFLKIAFQMNRYYRKIISRMLLVSFIITIIIGLVNWENFSSGVKKKIESLNFVENLNSDISNRTRFGIQYTSVMIFLENPIFGVGYGQQAFYGKDLYPNWATKNNYEFSEIYLNENVKSFPPGFNLYTRFLAETGIIGFIVLSFFLFIIILQNIKIIRQNSSYRDVSIMLLVSFVGFIINWLQIDSFRMFGFWICLAMLITIVNQRNMINE